MKIFSLQKTILIWSFILGSILNFVTSYFLTIDKDWIYNIYAGNDFCQTHSWCIWWVEGISSRLRDNAITAPAIFMLALWILLVFIILSLIRYFRNKKS